MNIFEFLGLPADHRKSSKVTQLVKHFDEVVDKHKVGKTFIAQEKKDGVCALLVVSPRGTKIFSRTGKEFTNTCSIIDRLPGLPLGVYCGELCSPTVSLEVLSGLVNPNRTKDVWQPAHIDVLNNLTFFAFDMLLLEEFIIGACTADYLSRYAILDGQETNTAFSVLQNHDDPDALFKEVVEAGGEGIIYVDPNAGWVAGHKGWRKMKKVRGVDYDLECIGYEEGTGKYEGKVANLIFRWKDDKTIKCMLGKGWTHNAAAAMFSAIEYSEMTNVGTHPNDPRGKIFQVYALQESSKGKLRLPKVGELRHDKDKADV